MNRAEWDFDKSYFECTVLLGMSAFEYWHLTDFAKYLCLMEQYYKHIAKYRKAGFMIG